MKSPILAVIVILFLISCDLGNQRFSYVAKTQLASGVAAKGVYFPNGSLVEIRSAPGIAKVESYVFDKDGNQVFELDGSPTIAVSYVTVESSLVSGAIIDDDGHFSVDITGLATPLLLRVQDTSTSIWYYSIVLQSADSYIANINPYSDYLIRQWYLGTVNHDNPANIDIDDVFPDGTLKKYSNGDPVGDLYYSVFGSADPGRVWFGKPMSFPDDESIQKVKMEQAYLIEQRYAVVLNDVLTSNWVAGDSYDALLDVPGFELTYTKRICSWMFYNIGIIESANAYFDSSSNLFHFDLWTKYGNSGNVIVRLSSGYVNALLESTVGGVNHYSYSNSYTVPQRFLDFEIEDFTSIPAERMVGLETYVK